jgi:hypothetical protein
LSGHSLFSRAVASMLLAAAILATVMAVLAPVNQRRDLWRGPPDEYGHRAAAGYYIDHWLPPRVGDPATLDSYSLDYGLSYLNDYDPAYPLAGKFAKVILPVVPNADLAVRLFNVALLFFLAGICIARPGAALVFVPLALSPQVWYIFSYCNNDALPLFLSMLLAWQVVDPASAFNRFLDGVQLRGSWWGALGFVLMVALLFLSKKNFLAVLALLPALIALQRLGWKSAALIAGSACFAAAWYQGWFPMHTGIVAVLAVAATAATFWTMLASEDTRAERTRVLARLGLLCTLAVAAALPRLAWDAYVHGSIEKRQELKSELQEKYAKPGYKREIIETKPQAAFHGIELRNRGVPLAALFQEPWLWHIRTFATATGSYGWLEFEAGTAYRALLLLGYLAVFGTYAWSSVRAREPIAVVGFAQVVAFSTLTVGLSLFFSWNNDFQAQGRYLFPVLPILGAGLFLARDRLPLRILLAAIAACFLISAYSFVFIGLARVPGAF